MIDKRINVALDTEQWALVTEALRHYENAHKNWAFHNPNQSDALINAASTTRLNAARLANEIRTQLRD